VAGSTPGGAATATAGGARSAVTAVTATKSDLRDMDVPFDNRPEPEIRWLA
jgi:hypothetical protein